MPKAGENRTRKGSLQTNTLLSTDIKSSNMSNSSLVRGFIPGVQGGLHILKQISVIHGIERLKKKNLT